MTTEITDTMIVLGPEMPAWIVWEDLSASEEATLRRMWNESVDRWLEWALGFLDTEPPGTDFSVPWDLRYTYIGGRQLAELRKLPAGDERRECLYEMLRQPPERSRNEVSRSGSGCGEWSARR